MLFKLPVTIRLLLFISIMSAGVSCNDNSDKKNQKVQIENDDSFAGSSKRADICQMIKEDDIRFVFDLSNEVEIKQKESKSVICSYGWEDSGKEYLYYTVSLNFVRGGERTDSQINTVWENQNETLYNRFQLQDVSGIGDKASWSKLGGGQLRVASNGSIFYVSLSLTVMPGDDKPMEPQEMIDQASALAKKVIKRM